MITYPCPLLQDDEDEDMENGGGYSDDDQYLDHDEIAAEKAREKAAEGRYSSRIMDGNHNKGMPFFNRKHQDYVYGKGVHLIIYK